MGTTYPDTGYELSFSGFVQLIRSRDRTVKKFLADSYGYSISGSSEAARVLNGHNDAIDLAWLHERIQEDEAQRREIYGIAMMLWR